MSVVGAGTNDILKPNAFFFLFQPYPFISRTRKDFYIVRAQV